MRITISFENQDIPKFGIVVGGQPPDLFNKQNCKVGIDTGFSGFLSIPLSFANNVGLSIAGTMPVELADGKSQPFSYCSGMVEISDKSAMGIILISPSDDILIGMEFLKNLALKLIVNPVSNMATLTDEEVHIEPSGHLPDHPN